MEVFNLSRKIRALFSKLFMCPAFVNIILCYVKKGHDSENKNPETDFKRHHIKNFAFNMNSTTENQITVLFQGF